MAEEKKSTKVEKLVEEIAGLSVLELSELTKSLQDKLGVTPMSMAAPAATPAGDAAAPAAAGGVQTVVMTAAGANKIAVIKALREINPQLGLKEAKDMTEKMPAEVAKDVKADEAKTFADKLKAAGATVELK
ncbi:MAG TPA: 50S ribosomal protein L7/L12 [Patescibacteria group bacterium]